MKNQKNIFSRFIFYFISSLFVSQIMTNLITATRYYGNNADDLQRLNRFIDQAETYSKEIFIGVHIEKDLSQCIKNVPQRASVHFIPIQPWIGISTPLNILLNLVPQTEQFLLIQSIEIQCSPKEIHRLQTYLNDENVLCAGAALDGHQRVPNAKRKPVLLPLQGDTSPWNTFVIWNLSKLRRTGFPTCSDFLHPPGMEDSAAIALQQQLFGGREQNRALLVRFGDDVRWLTSFEHDDERLSKHQIKMKSKNSRTDEQLRLLNLSPEDQQRRFGVEYVDESHGEEVSEK